jgi:DNA-binding PadR family transcriptional regulator
VNEQLPKFSTAERLIVELLADEGELFGLQMVERSGGRLKRGTVYVTLGRMQEKGYLESRQEPLPEGAIGLPRRLYRPTGHAMRVLDAWRHAERSFMQALEAEGAP